MARTWEVDTGITLRKGTEYALALSKGLEELLKDFGIESHSAGAGFGFRDMQFEAPSKRTAKKACKKAKAFLSEHLKGKEDYYISYYKRKPIEEE